MDKYPAIDSAFAEWGAKVGLTEAEVAEDWRVYCDDLVRFHEEVSVVMGETVTPTICVGGSQ